MSIFEDYAEYYDRLYGDKEYRSEVSYVGRLLAKYSRRKVRSVLSIGCGTGRYETLLVKQSLCKG